LVPHKLKVLTFDQFELKYKSYLLSSYKTNSYQVPVIFNSIALLNDFIFVLKWQ